MGNGGVLKELISKLTWVDYIALVALLRGLYVGYKSGFFHELLRLAGYVVAIVVTILFYEPVAQLLTLHTFLNLASARAIAFFALLTVVYIVVKIIRAIIVKLLKVGNSGALNRILGMAIGGARLLLLLSFFFVLVDKAPLKQLQEDVHQRSLTGSTIAMAAPMTLEFMAHLSPQLSLIKTDA